MGSLPMIIFKVVSSFVGLSSMDVNEWGKHWGKSMKTIDVRNHLYPKVRVAYLEGRNGPAIRTGRPLMVKFMKS